MHFPRTYRCWFLNCSVQIHFVTLTPPPCRDGGKSITRAIGRGGPLPKWHSLRSCHFRAQISHDFQGPPLPMALIIDVASYGKESGDEYRNVLKTKVGKLKKKMKLFTGWICENWRPRHSNIQLMCGVRPTGRVRRLRPYCQGRGRPLELSSRDSARGNFTLDARKIFHAKMLVFIISYDENPTTSRKSN